MAKDPQQLVEDYAHTSVVLDLMVTAAIAAVIIWLIW